MILRIRRPRIASLRLAAPLSLSLLASLGANSAFAAEPATQPNSTATQVEEVKQVAAELGQDEQKALPVLINDAVSITSRRYLTADVHTPWQIMHGLLALRDEYRIKVDGEKVQALNWLTQKRLYKDKPIIEHTPYGGRFHPFTEPYAFEGHPNQFLAILTMSELPVDFTFDTTVGGQVSIQDMLNNAKAAVNDREEITWTLWALSRYLPVDSEWFASDGEPWSIERLVQIQTYADPNEAACGGTHGLFALALARNSYLATGQPLRGIWFEADQKVRRYVALAKSLQNDDGTFSSEYFRGPGQSKDFGKRIATSGHILEFLMVAASEEELKEEWLQKAIYAVANELVENRKEAADCGPLYHALHALVLYRQRAGIDPTETTMAVRTEKAKPGETPAESASTEKEATAQADSTSQTEEPGLTTPPDAKPAITLVEPAKPAKIEPKLARQPEESSPLLNTEPLKVKTDRQPVRRLSKTELQELKSAMGTEQPSPFEYEVAKPIIPQKSSGDALPLELPEADEDQPTAPTPVADKTAVETAPAKVTYRLPEDNAYRPTDAGPGSENVSEIPLPPTED